MKNNKKNKLGKILTLLCAALFAGSVTSTAMAQMQFDPDQAVNMIAGTLSITEEQKPGFSKTMKAFFEKVGPLMQQMMSGGDQAEIQGKMQSLNTELATELSGILTDEQMQAFQDMQRNMGPPPQ